MKNLQFNRFEKGFLMGGIALTIIISLLSRSPLAEVIFSLCSVISAILTCKARLEGYIGELIADGLYLIFSLREHYYGEVASAVIIGIISLTGLISWIRNRDKDNVMPVSQADRREVLISLMLQILLLPLYYLVLRKLQSAFPLLSGLNVAATFLAVYFMSRAKVINYVFYLLKDALVILLWFSAISRGSQGALMILLPNLLYVINDIYGLISWQKMAENK